MLPKLILNLENNNKNQRKRQHVTCVHSCVHSSLRHVSEQLRALIPLPFTTSSRLLFLSYDSLSLSLFLHLSNNFHFFSNGTMITLDSSIHVFWYNTSRSNRETEKLSVVISLCNNSFLLIRLFSFSSSVTISIVAQKNTLAYLSPSKNLYTFDGKFSLIDLCSCPSLSTSN